MSEIKRRPHTWDAEGEQCTLCGESEWIGTHCPGTAEERVRAAAPELLEAAKAAEKVIDILWVSHHANRSDDALEKLRAAISKATGIQS